MGYYKNLRKGHEEDLILARQEDERRARAEAWERANLKHQKEEDARRAQKPAEEEEQQKERNALLDGIIQEIRLTIKNLTDEDWTQGEIVTFRKKLFGITKKTSLAAVTFLEHLDKLGGRNYLVQSLGLRSDGMLFLKVSKRESCHPYVYVHDNVYEYLAPVKDLDAFIHLFLQCDNASLGRILDLLRRRKGTIVYPAFPFASQKKVDSRWCVYHRYRGYYY